MRTLLLLGLGAALTSLGTVAAQNTENVVLLEAPGNPLAAAPGDTRAVLWLDVNGDGARDLLAVQYAQENMLFVNQGDGTLVRETALPNSLLAPSLAKGAAAGDVDGDGDEDVLVVHGANQPNALHLNQGQGTFVLSATAGDVLVDARHSYDAALGDLDGDGDLDAVVVNRHQVNDLYFNDGLGTFTRAAGSPISLDAGASRAVELADLDGDGDLDVLVANSNHQPNFVYVNQGHAQSGVEGQMLRLSFDPLATDPGDSYGVRAGDLDGDGLPEVVVANRFGHNVLYRNTTLGGVVSFAPVLGGDFSATHNDSFDVALTDLDGDGDVDIVVANRATPNDIFMATDDAFDLVRAPFGAAVTGLHETLGVIAADLDGDGLPELVFAQTFGQANRLFANHGPMWRDLGASLAGTSGAPRLIGEGHTAAGQSVALRLRNGNPSSATLLVLGLTAITAPFRGGVLVPAPDLVHLGPSTDGAGELDAFATYPAGLPPAFEFTVQALISDGQAPMGFAFSNALRATGL